MVTPLAQQPTAPAASSDGPPALPPPGRVIINVDADLAELIDEYLAHRSDDARAIPQELMAEDYPGIWRRGHNMKGVGSAYGFDYLTDLGAALEAAARRRDSVVVWRCAEALTDYLARLDVRVEAPEPPSATQATGPECLGGAGL